MPGAPPIVHAEPAAQPAPGGRRRRGPGRRRRRRAARRPRRRPLRRQPRRRADSTRPLADGADLVRHRLEPAPGPALGQRAARTSGYTERRRRDGRSSTTPPTTASTSSPARGDDAATVTEQRRRALGRGHRLRQPGHATRPRTGPPTPSTAIPVTAWRVGRPHPVEGERLVVHARPARHHRPPDAPPADDRAPQPLDHEGPAPLRRRRRPSTSTSATSSRAAPGQRIDIGPRARSTPSSSRSPATTTARSPATTASRRSGSPSSRIGDAAPAVDEVVRLPADLLAAAGAGLGRPPAHGAAHPPAGRPARADPHRRGGALARTFTLPAARTFTRDRHGPGLRRGPRRRRRRRARRRPAGQRDGARAHLPGEPGIAGAAAVDGDPATAWQTPIARRGGPDASRSRRRRRRRSTTSTSTVLADGRHSVPTALALTRRRRPAGRPSPCPPVADDPSRENATATVPVTLPAPVTARTLGRDPRRHPRRCRRPTTSAASPPTCRSAIAELGRRRLHAAAPAGAAARAPAAPTSSRVDGTPVRVRVDGHGGRRRGPPAARPSSRAAARSRSAAGAHDCAPPSGATCGIDVDRLVLDSGARRRRLAAPARPAPPAVTSTRPDPACPTTCAVDGAHAAVLARARPEPQRRLARPCPDGHDLGAPTLVDGYANGWRITPPPGGAPSPHASRGRPSVSCGSASVGRRWPSWPAWCSSWSTGAGVPGPLEPSDGPPAPAAGALVVAGGRPSASPSSAARPAGLAAAATAAAGPCGPRRAPAVAPAPACWTHGRWWRPTWWPRRSATPSRPTSTGPAPSAPSTRWRGPPSPPPSPSSSCRRGKRLVRPPNCVSGPVTR